MSKQPSVPPASSKSGQPVKQMNAPSPVIIIVCIILISALASYIIPAGSFTRVEDPNTGRMVVDPSSFQLVERNPTTFFQLF